MKWIILTVAGGAAFIIFVLFAWPEKKAGSEPFQFGRDVCDHCRMIISRPGFGGELRDGEGVLTKYDDLGCLLRAMFQAHQEFPEVWVEDHLNGEFVALVAATLVRDSRIQTPMAYNILAFKDAEAARTFAKKEGGEVVALEVLLKDRKRLEAKGAHP